MEQISFFLEKFKNLGLASEAVKRAFIETVEKTTGASLPPGSVAVKDDTIFVKARPALKSELFIKREQILAGLFKLLGKAAPARLR